MLEQAALTFDDGPHPEVTPVVLDILAKYKAKATFFMLGQQAELYPDIVKRVAEEGHEIGNHTWSHPNLTELSEAQIKEELNRTAQMIESLNDKPPALIRPPYGSCNEQVQAASDGPLIMWSVDSEDWKVPPASTIVGNVNARMHNGAIILMHDTYQATAEATEQILAHYTDIGYSFITVSELLGFARGLQPTAGRIYRSYEGSTS